MQCQMVLCKARRTCAARDASVQCRMLLCDAGCSCAMQDTPGDAEAAAKGCSCVSWRAAAAQGHTGPMASDTPKFSLQSAAQALQ